MHAKNHANTTQKKKRLSLSIMQKDVNPPTSLQLEESSDQEPSEYHHSLLPN
jgi:hypothetical protein